MTSMSAMIEKIEAMPNLPVRKELCWLEHEEDDDEEDYCPECAEKEAKDGWEVRYSHGMYDADGSRICNKCFSLLSVCLTDGGVDDELEHFEAYGIDSPENWAILLMIMETGMYQDDYEWSRKTSSERARNQYDRTCKLFMKHWKD